MNRRNKKSIEDEIGRIRVLTKHKYPYLFGLVNGVKIREIEGEGKAYTNGRYVYMTKDIIRNRNINYKIYIHEILHIGLLHIVRFRMLNSLSNMELYNVITDSRINNMIREKIGDIPNAIYNLEDIRGFTNYLTLEEMRDYNRYDSDYLFNKCRDKDIDIRDFEMDMTGEPDDTEDDNSGDEPNNSGENNKDVPEEFSRQENNKPFTENEIKDMLKEGIVYGRSIGAERGDLENTLEGIVNDLVDWKKIVIRNAHNLCERKNDYSRLHKKSYLGGYPLLPRRRRKEGIHILIGIDTSGSMDMEDIKLFLGSLLKVVKDYKATLEVMEIDYDTQKIFEVKNVRDLSRVDIIGGGGTSYKPFIKYIKEKDSDLSLLFTDGYGDQTEINEKIKNMYWIITRGGSMEGFKFGRVFRMK